MTELSCVILAAGLGTRMKSRTPKVMHRVCGKPIIHYPVSIALAVHADPIVVVVGHGADQVKEELTRAFPDAPLRFAMQEEQKGTGHAVMCAVDEALTDFPGKTLILSGDVTLLTSESAGAMVHFGSRAQTAVTLMSAEMEDPTGYGRILRGPENELLMVVEHKDCSDELLAIAEVNAGIYLVNTPFLNSALAKVDTNNAQGEYYLPDIVSVARQMNLAVEAFRLDDEDEIRGINNRLELFEAEQSLQHRINVRHLMAGVTFRDPLSTNIEDGVTIGRDTEIDQNVSIRGDSTIGEGCVIEAGVRIRDCRIGDNVHIKPYCVLEQAEVAEGCAVGPFAHLRPHSKMMPASKVGNFVELKKTTLGSGSKASHLSYLGDAQIGANVNIGAGTITCNYDGKHKFPTTIEDGVFIGSDAQLVAPVTVAKNAVVAAGATVVEDVPEGALAISRTHQENREGYSEKRDQKWAREEEDRD